MNRVAYENRNRVVVSQAEQDSRVRVVEEIARRRLHEEPMTDYLLEEYHRLTRMVRTNHTARKNSSYRYMFYYTFGSFVRVFSSLKVGKVGFCKY